MVAIHFGTRTVLEEIGGFLARLHLRAVFAAVARECLAILGDEFGDSDRWRDAGRSSRRDRALVPELQMQLPAKGAHDDENEQFFHDERRRGSTGEVCFGKEILYQ